MDILFPYEKKREIQDEFMDDIVTALKGKRHLLAHVPTGVGKSAAILSTTIPFAIENNLNVFFLTSRHTQHKIALETLKQIKEKHNANLRVVDLIGKKHMCLVSGIETLSSQQFSEYCREMIEKGSCNFYNRIRNNNKLSFETKDLLSSIKNKILDVDEFTATCKNFELCPYEISLMKARDANAIIMDYYHIFSPSISPLFLKKTEKTLQNSIIIVDEAHNLPTRMREHLSRKLTTIVLERAIREAQNYDKVQQYLLEIKNIVTNLAENIEEERLVKREEFYIKDYEEIITLLEKTADDIREIKKVSYIGSVAQFMEAWQGPDESFARIVSKTRLDNKFLITLSYKCLDPSLISKDIIDSSYSVICMSGTLIPLEMYSDILGFKNPILKSYKNPFPSKNRLNLLVPRTSTKFTVRSPIMYQEIAKECASVVNVIPGNIIIFFPSYRLRDSIDFFFRNLCSKTTFYEQKGITKMEKTTLLENFKKEKDNGAVLLAVIGGNFSEGIDLPGDLLKAVIIAGLPLSKPDLETKELINYYDLKYSKGWDYAYIFPAMQKTIQAAGRCIRSETDKGIIVFLDERYAWNNYYKCFPFDFEIQITKIPVERIQKFFRENF